MSTATTTGRITAARTSVADLGPVLVSELPAVTAVPTAPSLLSRAWDGVVRRQQQRSFERVVRNAGHAEQHDLFAQDRHSR